MNISYKKIIAINYIVKRKMSNDKKYIIDPLTCLCKLALLNFIPDGTKIGIHNHILQIQEYHGWQWLERMGNGDKRFDMGNLIPSIIKAIKWYILDGEEKMEMDDELSEKIINIANKSILGLDKLKNTYKNDYSITIILKYFENLLRDSLNNTWNDENLIDIDYNPDQILSDKIKKNFTRENIITISKMMDDAMNTDELKNKNSLVVCIIQLLDNMDENFKKLMNDIVTKL